MKALRAAGLMAHPALAVSKSPSQTMPVLMAVITAESTTDVRNSSIYKAFDPAEARRLAERIEIRYTPAHGSWLNIAECELSVLSRHCLRTRTPSVRSLIRKVTLWAEDRNKRQCGIDWQFTTADARIKLKRLYPQI